MESLCFELLFVKDVSKSMEFDWRLLFIFRERTLCIFMEHMALYDFWGML
jgi:hypothetical protein